MEEVKQPIENEDGEALTIDPSLPLDGSCFDAFEVDEKGKVAHIGIDESEWQVELARLEAIYGSRNEHLHVLKRLPLTGGQKIDLMRHLVPIRR